MKKNMGRNTVTAPAEFAGYAVYLEMATGGEAQVFLDGEPYQGMPPTITGCRFTRSTEKSGMGGVVVTKTFGVTERAAHCNHSHQKAMFEVPALSFADLSEGNYGAALISAEKYGFSVLDGRMGISLLRSPTFPDPEADQGKHVFSDSAHSSRVCLTVDIPVTKAVECNLAEEPVGGQEWTGNPLVFRIRPFEIKTVRLYR